MESAEPLLNIFDEKIFGYIIDTFKDSKEVTENSYRRQVKQNFENYYILMP